ncbi:MAG: S8 family serine peptidase, partial [Alphaproteobacteria bacterium]|nr:S8 family serine peptidase [Alphaproteobacteria bacterium]
MRLGFRSCLFLMTCLCSGFLVNNANASVSAKEVYKQAKDGNVNYLRLIKRYDGAIDTVDKNGDTAYCLALRQKDKNAQALLKEMGADTKANCVESAKKNKQVVKDRKIVADKKNSRFREDDDNASYNLLTGGVVVGVAGGVVALASAGGGGGGGSKGGSSSGGSSSGGSGTPNKPVEGSVSPETFSDVKEYNVGNFLGNINASKAYSFMYTKDSDGNLVSHRAADDKPLSMVKVGVFDTGVYANEGLSGKIISGYDANKYNSDADLYAFDAGNVEYYIYKKNNLYYPIIYYSDETWDKGSNVALTREQLQDYLEACNAEFGTDVEFSDFVVMNADGKYSPGIGTLSLDEFFNAASKAGYINHGTHVAGIIAANKDDENMHGVAFENAKLVVVSWDTETEVFSGTKYMIDEGVQVINNSWGVDQDENGTSLKMPDIESDKVNIFDGKHDDVLKAYAYTAKNGAVWVESTGNAGASQPSLYIGLPTLDLSNLAFKNEKGEIDTSYAYAGPNELEAPFVAVTAIDSNKTSKNAPKGTIADFANRCGDASAYCLAAPGVGVNSTIATEDGMAAKSGTSQATPVVSGSIALLKGYYNWLSAQNIAYLLLETADNSGAYANSAIYGQGVLDLEAAVTTPLGDLKL